MLVYAEWYKIINTLPVTPECDFRGIDVRALCTQLLPFNNPLSWISL